MLQHTKQSLHYGVNFVIAPPPVLDGSNLRRFQDALASEGLEFTATNFGVPNGGGIYERGAPTPLQLRVVIPAPQAPMVQLLILAANPARPLEVFIEEAESITEAFLTTWGGRRQVVARDCAVHHLYDVAAEHAFQYLWEQRVASPDLRLDALERPVLGGGLRFVMPPTPGEDEPRQIEVKVESFLADSRKLYVDVTIAWPTPRQPDMPFDPRAMMEQVESYATEQVVAFITGENS